jgi:glycosyltransferase involved in cell wall biosynthesis
MDTVDVTPTVSVLMTVFNAESFLAEAISSILEQTYPDFEFVIVDDASRDNSVEVAQSFSDSRIRFYRNRENLGQYASLNVGLTRCRGRFIARMDADDVCHPERLRRQVEAMQDDDGLVLCGCMADTLDGTQRYRYPRDDREIKVLLFWTCPFAHPGVMIRRSCLVDMDQVYDTRYRYGADYDLWIRLVARGRFRNLEGVYLRYRRHENSMTALLVKSVEDDPDQIRLQCVRSILGGEETEGERYLHMQLLNHDERDPPFDFADATRKVQDMENWVGRLSSANRQTGLFPEPEFSQHLLHRMQAWARKQLVLALRGKKRLSARTLTAFWFGRTHPYRYFPRRQRVKFTLSCLGCFSMQPRHLPED